ncbi:MAG TPA: peptidoglycan-binding domain-containing protein, partial [Fibrobacteria bacterium]|nr:peptidoglycan-binding domain-containing protein [Fibrobacteria bacterium]
GWHCDPGKVDGVEGPKTRNGIYQFQFACNQAWGMQLSLDGKCGPKTWGGMYTTLKQVIKV